MKLVATFAIFFGVHSYSSKSRSRCPPFLFISDEHSVKQSKNSMLQTNIYK